MVGSPLISIILCTRNRREALAECLARLDREAVVRNRGELILVDNASTDATREEMERFAAQARIPVQVIGEPNPGLSPARNAGLRCAKGALFVFLDDDCYLGENYLDTVANVLPSAGYAFAGGRILVFDPNDSQYGTNRQETFELVPPGAFLRAGKFQGTNLAMRREIYEKIGGFDLEFGPGTDFRGDDIDYCARASLAGFAGAHVPELLVYHHHRRKRGAERSALERQNWIAGGAYYAHFILKGNFQYLTGWIRAQDWSDYRSLFWQGRGVFRYLASRIVKMARARPDRTDHSLTPAVGNQGKP